MKKGKRVPNLVGGAEFKRSWKGIPLQRVAARESDKKEVP